MKYLIIIAIAIVTMIGITLPNVFAQSHDGYYWDDNSCKDKMLEFDKQALLSLRQQLDESTSSEESNNLINAIITIHKKYCPSVNLDFSKPVSTTNGIYENELYDFSITPPSNWYIQENTQGSYLYGGTVIVEFGVNNFYNNYAPNISINFESDSMEKNQNKILETYRYAVQTHSNQVKIIDEEIKRIKDGYVLRFEFIKNEQIDYDSYQRQHQESYVFVMDNDDVYFVNYSAVPEDFETYRDAANRSMKSMTVHGIQNTFASNDSILKLSSDSKGGGCLIATATYGSEMTTEVQQLRELRDNSLLNTKSGTQFMQYFNEAYYSFSPVIADYERENPYFKEAVKLAITPLISSLSILNYVNMDSEESVLGYGISLIILILGMYLGVPAVVIIGIKKIK